MKANSLAVAAECRIPCIDKVEESQNVTLCNDCMISQKCVYVSVGYLLSAMPWLSTKSQGCQNYLEKTYYNLNNLLSGNPES